MPAIRSAPRYCRQNEKNRPDRAYVRFNGQRILLGNYGSPESYRKYAEIINADPNLVRQINSFQISSYEDEEINRRLKIRLETVKNLPSPLAVTEQLHRTMFEGLCRVNQDFREVTKMFDRNCVELEIYEFETGPFAGRDIRVKNKYVAE